VGGVPAHVVCSGMAHAHCRARNESRPCALRTAGGGGGHHPVQRHSTGFPIAAVREANRRETEAELVWHGVPMLVLWIWVT